MPPFHLAIANYLSAAISKVSDLFQQESQMAYGTADEALLTVIVMFKKMSHY